MHATCLTHLILLDSVTWIFGEEYKLWSCPFSALYLGQLRYKWFVRFLDSLAFPLEYFNRTCCWNILDAANAVSGRTSPVSAMSPITSLSKKALTHLVQSPGSQTPGCFARQPSLQRMHHNIPHRYIHLFGWINYQDSWWKWVSNCDIIYRFDQKLCVRAIKCAACLDSIHFGHYAFICQECDITAHPKVNAATFFVKK